MEQVGRKRAAPPLLIALDIGSSATRGRVIDARGRTLKRLEARVRHALDTGPNGSVTCDAEAMLAEVEQVIDALLDAAGKRVTDVAGVALDTFAATLVGVDARSRAVTPVYTYADSRPAAQVQTLRQRLNEDDAQQRTGCRFHASYVPARFLWLQDTAPELLKRSRHWLSLGEFIYYRLLGQRAVSFSTAAWSGLLNRTALDWDADLLGVLPVTVAQLSPLCDTGEPLNGLRPAYARRWSALKEARWFPAIADGYASNVGSGALDGTTIALSIGTSAAARLLLPEAPAGVPHGLWCYAVNRRQSLLGGALNDGGRAINWLRELLQLPPEAELQQALAAPPHADTPVVLPFLTGERSPGWAANARASISGIDLHTDAPAIVRGMLEGVALRLAAIADELRGAGSEPARIVASGGGVEGMPPWLQIIADATGLPVAQSGEGQTTLLGTAMIALDVLAPGAERVATPAGPETRPLAKHAALYAEKRARLDQTYRALLAG